MVVHERPLVAMEVRGRFRLGNVLLLKTGKFFVISKRKSAIPFDFITEL